MAYRYAVKITRGSLYEDVFTVEADDFKDSDEWLVAFIYDQDGLERVTGQWLRSRVNSVVMIREPGAVTKVEP